MAGGTALSSLSPPIAFIFVFNLVVGVGGLALPLAFSKAGIVLSSAALLVLGFLAYVTLTWIVECMSIANFLLRWRVNALVRRPQLGEIAASSAPYSDYSMADKADADAEANAADAAPSVFDITERVELGEMASMFTGVTGTNVFYALLCIYLIGDLVIYAVFVPVTLSKVCGDFSIGSLVISENDSYYFFLALFAALVLPFCFMNFSNTKPLQLFCMAMRNIALMTMIGLALARIAGGTYTPSTEIVWANVGQISTVMGTGIYAFMCHHSLPSIVTPITDKRNLSSLFLADYSLIFGIYLLLCISAQFAFAPDLAAKCLDQDGPACRIQGPYTLNFTSYHVRFVAHFLTLFPVFTLTSNFPLISITLRNNVRALARSVSPRVRAWMDAGAAADATVAEVEAAEGEAAASFLSSPTGVAASDTDAASASARYSALAGLDPSSGTASPPAALISVEAAQAARDYLRHEGCLQRVARRHGATLVAVTPPLLMAIFTQNVNQLVSYTGGFAGLAIQYIIPAWMVFAARRLVERLRRGDGETDSSLTASLSSSTLSSSLSSADSDTRARDLPSSVVHASGIVGQRKSFSMRFQSDEPEFWTNPHRSPFEHNAWIGIIGAWSLVCLGFIIYNLL